MAGSSYEQVKGTISSLQELNLANQRYNGQLEGETTFENQPEMTVDEAHPWTPQMAKEHESLKSRQSARGLNSQESARFELLTRHKENQGKTGDANPLPPPKGGGSYAGNHIKYWQMEVMPKANVSELKAVISNDPNGSKASMARKELERRGEKA